MPSFQKEALDYHAKGKPGKIEVIPTKPTQTQKDLSLAYSPGVAEPCLEIEKNPEDVYQYTSKGNLVGVISNGTAVLGLGDLGPEASKPVMEGKGVLFKVFADIDVFDIEVDKKDIDGFVETVKAISPTFGGINLEDIGAPESFEIERRLKEETDIPIMHDDQHGTAIITGAGLLNALKLVDKKIGNVKVIVNGAGASAMASAKLFLSLGVKKQNLWMLDRTGLITKSRKDLDQYKSFFAVDEKDQTLEDALFEADVFVGLSAGNILAAEWLHKMNKDPIVFALANPDPEIDYQKAISTREDIIMATGRSDHPNQVNNVLGFPFIFRGALDVRAKGINEEMKIAAVHALAELTHEPVPEIVTQAYGLQQLTFGKDYLIPKPIDPRLITAVAPAVAQAAMESGIARLEITDWGKYKTDLRKRMGLDNKFIQKISTIAKKHPKRIAFCEGDHPSILQAAAEMMSQGSVEPILLGKKQKIESLIDELNLEMPYVPIIDPLKEFERRKKYAELLYQKRKRKGITRDDAVKLMRHRNYFANAMMANEEVDVVISGLTKNYPSAVSPALQLTGLEEGLERVAGMYAMVSKRGPLFFADTTININPSWQDLVNIALLTHKTVKRLGYQPIIAIVSYTNFGSAKGETPEKVQKAIAYLHKNHPELTIDGDLQANIALDQGLRDDIFPFNKLCGKEVNTLIFPNLAAGNIAYKLVSSTGPTEALGPILMGFKKSVHVLQLGSSVREIINMVNLAIVDAHNKA
ncbi:MAG: NADP-dependent malic enzyme [Bacteroidota bacterium]|nr:NADP-dependent malic enzyme [Bacteroidota bacterium]